MAAVTILFFAGVALVIAEFFLPGMVLGIVGGLCLLAGCIYGMVTHPEYALFIFLWYFLGALAAVMAGVMILPRTRFGRSLTMEDGLAADASWVSDPTDTTLIGKRGEVFSPLRPVGMVTIDGRRLNAVSEGTYIDQGRMVEIVKVQGNRVVVEEVESSSE